jgi:hypothetical protein
MLERHIQNTIENTIVEIILAEFKRKYSHFRAVYNNASPL